MTDVCCLQHSRMLGWKEGDIKCVGLQRKTEMVVWKIW